MTDNQLAESDWDAVIVGAGPAGALIAHRLATSGHSVLVIDKETFPRPKVCGGCLGAIGGAALKEAGIDLTQLGVESTPLNRVAIHSGRCAAVLPLNGRRTISRERFDSQLLEHAVEAGAESILRCRAKLGTVADGFRKVEVTTADGGRHTVRGRLVVLAAGLGAGRLLPPAERPATIKRSLSRIGTGTTLTTSQPFGDACTVTMACGRNGEGYVGLATLPDGKIDVAAALDPRAVTSGTARLAASILRQAALAVPEGFIEAEWRATPQLTQRPTRLGAERVLLIGDAAGYVEPFTGEGIGWALRSALEAEPFAAQAIDRWSPTLVEAWTARHGSTLGQWQRRCDTVCGLIGGRWATPLVVGTLSAAPWIAAPLLRRIDPAA